MSKIKAKKGRRSPMVMYKTLMENALRARLKWLLDFLNKDLNSLNPVECWKLFYDFCEFALGDLSSTVIEKEYDREFRGKPYLLRTLLHSWRAGLASQLRKILVAQERSVHEENYAVPYVTVDKYSITYTVNVAPDRIFETPDILLLLAETGDPEESVYIRDGILTGALIRAISPFPLSRIRICQKPDCQNFFFQKTTKSKGDFCSRKCQNWARTTRWRKGNPDKYNAYHRNRRAKAKEPWVKITCLKCGHEYPKGHPDPGKCSRCGGKLRYEVQFLESRTWNSEQCRDFNEAEELRKEILEYEEKEREGENGKR